MDTTNATSAAGADQPAPKAFDSVSSFRAAYERRLPEIVAVKEADLLIDVHTAIATVLGALPEIKAFRSVIATLSLTNQSLIDAVEDYAQAAGEANSRYVTAMTPREDIVALNEAASKLRETLRSDAMALANRGLTERARFAPFKGAIGYKNVAFELMDWANLLRDCWSKIEGKTALTSEELASANQVGERLVRAAGLRDQAPTMVAEVARIRQQAVTVLVHAYEEVRRAVIYIRWFEEDADTIVPSLYKGRGRRAARADEPEEQPAAPAVNPAADVTGGATTATGPAAPAVPPGHPGGNPFVSN